jgi:hypothetical protein
MEKSHQQIAQTKFQYQAIPKEEAGMHPYSLHDSGASKPRSRRRKLVLFGVLLTALSSLFYLFLFRVPSMGALVVPDLIRVESLHPTHYPDYDTGSRLVLVGDVHGSYRELKKVLKKAKFKVGRDHLVLLGDFITKGPRSLDVIDLAIDLNASCVRGNHENEILEMYAKYHNLPAPRIAAASSLSKEEEEHDDIPISKREDLSDDDVLVRNLKPRHIQYLGQCPAILQLGDNFGRGYSAAAVHAGLMWNINDLEEQDPNVVMTIRSVLPPDFAVASEDSDGKPWSNVWNEKQEELPLQDRTVIYYGHDARSGLNIKEYTKGLDSGCVKGRELTAMVISDSKKGNYKEKLVSVDC